MTELVPDKRGVRPTQHGGRCILTARRIITGEPQGIIADGFVAVAGGVIESVGRGTPRSQPHDDVIALGDATVLPGLVDCHDHLLGRSRLGQGVVRTSSARAYRAVLSQHAGMALRRGVTTVRVPGVPMRLDLELRAAIQSNAVTGPRLIGAGLKITAVGGHGGPAGVEVSGAEAARRATQREIEAGVDFVKLIASGGVGSTSESDSVTRPELTIEEMSGAVAVAHVAARRVTAHANGEAITNALRAGVDCIEHGIYLNAAHAREMASRAVALVPTLSAMTSIASKGYRHRLPRRWIDNARGVIAAHRVSFEIALEHGVHIAAGTDGFGDLVDELILFTRYGMTPHQALIAATRDAARVVSPRPSFGTLSPGAAADVLAVHGDPLASLDALRSVALVMSMGQIIVRTRGSAA